jgi:hypothetical protein
MTTYMETKYYKSADGSLNFSNPDPSKKMEFHKDKAFPCEPMKDDSLGNPS